MQKKGQLAAFVVVGFLFLLTVFILTTSDRGPYLEQPMDTFEYPEVARFVEGCIAEMAEKGLWYISLQGGYFDLPERATHDQYKETAYYVFENVNIAPSLDIVERELSKYVEKHIVYCLDFSVFPGLSISHKKPLAQSIVRDDFVDITVDLSIEIMQAGRKTSRKSFSSSVRSDLHAKFSAATDVAHALVSGSNSLCLSCVANVAESRDLEIYLDPMNSHSTLITITDDNNEADNRFIFAHKFIEYSCRNLPPEVNNDFMDDCVQQELAASGYRLLVEQPENLTLKVGEMYRHRLQTTGVDVTYSSSSFLLHLNEQTGEFGFAPSEHDLGTHTIEITAIDKFSNRKTVSFEVRVTG